MAWVGDLPGEDDHRDGVHVCGGDAGDGVCESGSGGDEADAGFAGCAGVSVGGVDGSLLVADEDVANFFLLEEFRRR